MPSAASASFADSKYFNLRSFKKDGQPVDTPVWFAPVDGKWFVWTNGTSYKVKRIRRNPRVEVACCGMRGQLLGEWQPAKCRAVESEPELMTRAYDALKRKYGLMMRIGVLFSKHRLLLEVTLDA
jgi:PPOX class probable F420-dependent enzyme